MSYLEDRGLVPSLAVNSFSSIAHQHEANSDPLFEAAPGLDHPSQFELHNLEPSGRPEDPNSARSSSDDSQVDYEPDDPLYQETSMNRKNRSSKQAAHAQTQADSDRGQNGGMSAPLEHRRKFNANVDESAARRANTLLDRESFTLDESPQLPGDETSKQYGFFDLPRQDQRNFLLLVSLYFLQGIPMGLAGGSVPFLLKSPKYGVSYSQIGIFSLAIYPYSLKLLWSPIVDAIWSRRVGRRKSWILPIQVLSGMGMIWLGTNAEAMLEAAGADGGAGIWGFTGWWFFLVFTCATQDIAVDGWAITVLSQKHLAYASTAQTVGLTGGSFLSYTVFLAFSDPHFANQWFRSQPLDQGIWTLGGYLTFWGWAYIAATVALGVLKREDKTKDREGVLQVYRVMLGVLKLKNVQTIIIIHLISKIGFQANDAVTNLKLLEKGFGQDNLSLTVLIDFPFELTLGYYAGKWSSTYPPMQLWCWAFVGRLVAAGFAQIVVLIFPAGGVTTWYLFVVIAEHIFSTFMSTIMFVAIAAFHAYIADPVIGGTYMTLLATVSNLGGTFPRFFVLKFVDIFTKATCQPPSPGSVELSKLPTDVSPIMESFSCALEADKQRCTAGAGVCKIDVDGYYIMNIVCILIGIATFVLYVRPKSLMLQSLPLKAWRLDGR